MLVQVLVDAVPVPVAITGPNASIATFTLSAAIVTALVGSFIPIAVGVVTKWTAPSWLKAWLHLLLSVINGAVVTATQLDGTAVFSRVTILTALGTWLVGIATYHGFWKPTQIAPTINQTTRNFGLGTGTTDQLKL